MKSMPSNSLHYFFCVSFAKSSIHLSLIVKSSVPPSPPPPPPPAKNKNPLAPQPLLDE